MTASFVSNHTVARKRTWRAILTASLRDRKIRLRLATKCYVNRYRYRKGKMGGVAEMTVQSLAKNGPPRIDTRQVAKQRADLLAINDPQPVEHVSAVWRTAAQAATIGIFIILFITALDLARAMLLPATSAFVFGLMLGPLSARAKAFGMPSLITAIVLWLLVVAVFYGVIILLATPALDWIAKAPEIGRIIKEKLQVLDQPLSALRSLRDAVMPQGDNSRFGFDIVNFVQPAVVFVTPAIGEILIFFGTLFFFLLGRARLRHVIVILFEHHDSRLCVCSKSSLTSNTT